MTPAKLAAKHNIEVWEDRIVEMHCRSCGSECSVHGGYQDANRDLCPDCSGDCSVTETGKRGWFYWSCAPGCLPDTDASGPYETEDLALADATEGLDDDDAEITS